MRRQEIAMLCPAGLESVVAAAASSELPRLHLKAGGPGFLRGTASASTAELRGLRCATNVFSVVACVRRSSATEEVTELARTLGRHRRPAGLPTRGTVRLRVDDDGGHTSSSGGEATLLEDALVRWTGLAVSSERSDLEAWVIRRPEQPETLLALEVTDGDDERQPGSLRAEVAAALAQLAKVRRADLVLDPFAGSGAVGAACVDAGARRVWLNDPAPEVLRPDRLAREHLERMRLTHLDLAALDALVPSGAVTSVVTHVPSGRPGSDPGSTVALHERLGACARRWLSGGGSVVVHTAADQPAVDGLLAGGGFDVHRELPILLDGHRAQVLRLVAGRRR